MLVAAMAALPALSAAQGVHGRATRHDVSPPLSEMALPPAAPTGLNIEVNPIARPAIAVKPSVEQAPDAARQDDAGPLPGAAPTPAPITTWEGVSDDDNAICAGTRVVPPDTEGDVGETYYVQWNNLCFEIYDKTTGASVFGPVAGNSIWNGFGGVCQSLNDGDPIVLYDHLAGRWFFSQFAINFGVQCVALSQGSDPQGPYDRWEFQVSPGQNNDYPKFGIMPESYVLTLRDFPSGVPPFASAVLFDRKAMLAGDASPRFVKDGLNCGIDCVDGWQPPHLEGPPPPAGTPVILTKVWDDDFDGPVTGCDGVRLWQYDVDWSVDPPTQSFASIGTACGANFDNDMCGFFNRNCIPQASATQRLDPIDELQMYRAQYRHWSGSHDSLVLNTTVDATSTDIAGQRWVELRNSGAGWSIYQEGTYAPADGENRWMGSAAMDGAGGIALGYSSSSSANDPSIRYTSREATDPLGTLPGGEVIMQAGGGAQTGANRWGDYSTMSVDPVDDCTFYYTQEYYQTTGSFDFNTKVGAFKLSSCNVTTCGNGFCQPGEDCNTCAADCNIETGGGGTPGVCGNGVCEPGFGEDCLSCSSDCRGKQKGKTSNRFCCGDGDGQNPIACNDNDGTVCNQDGFQCGTVGGPATVCCGDGFCDSANGECGVCERDCSRDTACGGGGECVPTSSKEKGRNKCANGIDDDCDGLIDGADPDCG